MPLNDGCRRCPSWVQALKFTSATRVRAAALSRNLGGTLGAAFLGAVLTYSLAHATNGETITPGQMRALLDGMGAVISDAKEVRLALQHTLHATFTAMLLIATLIGPD